MMNVTIYTLPNCVQCESTKRYLTKHSVSYRVVELESDPEAVRFIQGLGYNSAPVVYTDKGHWSGFRHGNLSKLVSMYHADEIHDKKTA